MQKVYLCFCTDIIHEGHLNILHEAGRLGSVTVGILTDSEMIKYNRFPTKSTMERVKMVEELPGVDCVVIQKTIMYDEVVKELRPDYIVHGNNWSDPGMDMIKKNILELLEKYDAGISEGKAPQTSGAGSRRKNN